MNLNHRGRRASRKKFSTKADSAECVSSDRQMEEMVVLPKQDQRVKSDLDFSLQFKRAPIIYLLVKSCLKILFNI